MDKKIRFRTYFDEPDPEREPLGEGLGGRSAVVEMTRDQVTTIAAMLDELGATAHSWNRRLDTSDDPEPEEVLFVDATLNTEIPFVVGDERRSRWEDRPGESELFVVPDAAPFENPRTALSLKFDAGWQRVYLYAEGAQAPIPLEGLRRHFDPDTPLLAYVYTDEPCRVCGRLITRSDVAESRYAGYSGEGEGPRSMRAMHGRCYEGVLAVMDDYERQRMTARPDFPEPGEPVRIFLNAERGPKGDRWLVEPVGGGLPNIVRDELVAGWQRRPAAEAKP